MKPNKPVKTRVILGQPSWRLASSTVEAFVTEVGGHLGPVAFDRQGRNIQPYSVAPWAEEKIDPATPAILKVLRGDFFCLPFGGNDKPYRGEKHPPHGETANARWTFESCDTREGKTTLHLSLNTTIRKGRVDKKIFLIDGQNVLYCQHTLSGMKGPMNLGHHAMLRFPDEPGSGVISTSRFLYGQVFPGLFETPENRGYCRLQPGAGFGSLEKVPTITGETTDLTRYPARRGFEDLVMMVADTSLPFAWTAVVFAKQRFVWFALRDPGLLRQTVFWISNGGRHYPPWNSRHVNVMGLEDVTSFFHPGLAQSAAENAISAQGWPTCLTLNPKEPLVIPYIMGVAAIPPGFDRVASIEAVEGKEVVAVKAVSGKIATVPLKLEFLKNSAAW